MRMRKLQKKAVPRSRGTGSSLIVALTRRAPLSHASSFFHNFSDLFRQAPFSLLFCSFTGLLAGIGLSLMTDMLRLLPGLMILIPPAIAMRGNVYSALVSRLGTSMHLGLFSPTLKKGSVLYQNASTSLLLTLILSVILGFLAKILADAFGMPNIKYISLQGFILISVIGGLISGIILLGIAILVSIIGYRRNWDLDNMSSPIITSAGDMITIPSLFLAAILLLNLNLLNTWWIFRGWLSPVTLLSVLFIFVAFFCLVKGLKSRDAAVRRIFIESIPMLFICGILCTLAGITLDMRLQSLIAIPAILVIIPPFLGESNALGGILSARLSSMLHIGTVNPKRVPDKLVSANFAVIYLFSIVVFSFVGILSYVASTLLDITTPNIFEMVSISLLGGILCTTFLNLASYYIAILSFRFGMDPDNDTIPLITSLTDVVGVLCLLFAMFIIQPF
ncbi:MAG: magnesium transporter [Methanophagales archaeon]|nr:magnesium transporter [Methanophagales archaeon]